MRIIYFTHSLVSCWNHGNAHFLRGVLRELTARGHDVCAYEPADGWSRANLLTECGSEPVSRFAALFPELQTFAHESGFDVDATVDGAGLVIAHEWNDPVLVSALGTIRARGSRFLLLFHDTHHRAVSDPEAMRAYDLSGYDGVLAFGEALAEVYREWGWADRVFVWHEAADTRLFRPPANEGPHQGLIWIGNWGDDERADELREFLLKPAAAAGLSLDVHGVRYPDTALSALAAHGARYRGWLANADVPSVFARHLATVHVPRRFYVDVLPGIPTIRIFEALACGIPLLCAPWQDTEGLFHAGRDYLTARSGGEMERHMRAVASDADLRAALIESGLATIRARHTCAHRVDELLEICERLQSAPAIEEVA